MKRNLLLFVTLLCAATMANAWKPTFVGHRGSLRGVMNTAEAYRNGADFYHYTGLECDVRVTKDGHYVISHDETLGAICDQDLNIAQSTLEELKAVDLHQTRDGVAYTAKICTVEEYLDICVEKNCFPMIELKYATGINNNDMSNFAGLYQLVKSKGLEEKAIFLTSMSKSIEYIKTHYPEATCQYLLSSDSDTKYEFCKKWKVNPSFQASVVTNSLVERYLNAGMQVAIWTVNSETNYKKYGEMGTFMMTCDYLRPNDMPDLTTWDPTVPREPSADALAIDANVVWTRSAVDGNLPANYPAKNGATFKSGQMAAMVDGKFYVNDYDTRNILIYDEHCTEPVVVPFSEAEFGGSPALGITSDDAGNIIQRFEGSITAAPSKVRLFRHGSTVPVTVDFELGENGAQCNFFSASGDVFSAEGGYLYFHCNGKFNVQVVHIADGELQQIYSYPVMIKGSSVALIVPIEGPDRFLYTVRNLGIYLYDKVDTGSLLTTSSTTAPNRNTSVGGGYVEIDGHGLMIHPSGSSYNGGFTIRDMKADLEPLVSFPALGTSGNTANASTGTFTKIVKDAPDHCLIYNYTMGHGYGVYEVQAKLEGVGSVRPADKATFTAFPNPVISTTALCASKPLGKVRVYGMDGRLALTADLGDATTASLDLSRLHRGIYIVVTESGQRLRLAKR